MAENPLPPFHPVDWHKYDLPTLWNQIQDESDTFTRMQERAWNRTYDLLDGFRARLEASFEATVEVWPNTPHSPSERFHDRFRTLIGVVSRHQP